ncbi:Serine aminopeptidase [Fragilaria crotonensis]|nr:Serine aminopeptidase [Fragilaria crotonensis]
MTAAVATATTATEQLLDTTTTSTSTTTATTSITTTSSETFLTTGICRITIAIQEQESAPLTPTQQKQEVQQPQRPVFRRWDVTAILCPLLLILAAAYNRSQLDNNNNNLPATSSITSISPATAALPEATPTVLTPQQLYQSQETLKSYHWEWILGTAESVDFVITEKNQMDQDYIVFQKSIVQLPEIDDANWTLYTLRHGDNDDDNHDGVDDGDDDTPQSGISVQLSMKRMTRPLYSQHDHDTMGLVEYLINLENGELASLAYKKAVKATTKNYNNRAVLYFAGRSDSFAHPHLLKMYERAGYDFYTLDVRRSGRARRFLKNPHLGNDVVDFKEIVEDVELALEYIHQQNNYTEIVAHCHSNGALVLFSYLLDRHASNEQGRKTIDFDGYILNSPFLAWGNVGGSLNEWLLRNAAMINYVYPQELWGHAGTLNDWWTKIWILYRWNLAWKPVITNSLTSHYAEAVSHIQQQVLDFEGFLLGDKPTLVMSSQSDDILQHSEILRLAAELHPNPTLVEFDFQSHDVTKSMTHDLNDRVVNVITDWLEDFKTYHTLD